MHIVKDTTTGFLFSPFAVGGVWSLQAAVLHYFDLKDPDSSLSEQEMWQETAPLLGQSALDWGFPKSRGEVLVAGRWFAPQGAPAGGGQVKLEVGNIKRRLLVFGPRYWQMGPAGPRPSQPEEVSTVALAWQNSFGGPEFAENPEGLGFVPQTTPWQEKRRYLPQLEDDNEAVTSPGQRPAPANFAPLPPGAASRQALAGSYDEAWKKYYWPGFPPDIKNDFFQMAQPGQRLPQGYFKGGEKVLLEGMHPVYARVESRLPRKRALLFFTRRPANSSGANYDFAEVEARAETIWLFPEIERGIMLYRAVIACADDEMSDIGRLFPVLENADAPLADIQHWHEEFKRRIAVPAPPDPAPLEAAKAAVEDVKLKIRTLEEDINFSLDQALGLAPAIPVPANLRIANARQMVQKALKQVDEAQKMLRQARQNYGHLAKFNPQTMDATRAALGAMLPKLDEMEKNLGPLAAANPLTMAHEARAAQAAQMLKQGQQALSANLSPDALAAHIPQPFQQEFVEKLRRESQAPALTWNQQALTLLAKCQLSMAAEDMQAPLLRSGLRKADFAKMGLGYLPAEQKFDPVAWALNAEQKAELREQDYYFGPGYLIPWFEGGACVRLALRPSIAGGSEAGPDLFWPCEQWLMPGSGEGVQILGGGQGERPFLLALDPLTAWLLYAQAGDLYAVLIATSVQAQPSPGLAALLTAAPFALLPVTPAALPAAADLRPQKLAEIIAPWQGLAPTAEAIVWENKFSAPNLVRAAQKGLDIRAWLRREIERRGLPVQPETGLKAEFNEKGRLQMSFAAPLPDVKAIQQRLSGRTDKAAAATKQQVEAAVADAHKEYAQLRANHGPGMFPELPPLPTGAPAVLPPMPPDGAASYDRAIEEYKLLDQRPLADKLTEIKAKSLADYERMRGIYADGQAQAAAMRTKAAQGIVVNAPWIKDVPGGEAVFAQTPMSPELALERLRCGQMEKIVLENLDLSGQDLSGCRWREVIMKKVNFKGANLRGCEFYQVMGDEINFNGADLSRARMEMCSWTKIDLTACQAQELNLKLSSMDECLFKDTQLQGAYFYLVTLKGVYQGIIQGLKAELLDLNGECRQLILDDCRFDNGAMAQSRINGLEVRGGALRAFGFVMCEGGDMRFKQVDAHNLRIINSNLNGVEFDGGNLSAASLRESVLDNLVLRGCRMDKACVESCQMRQAIISHCRAPEAVIAHSDLEGADLRGSSLPQASLRRTRLVRADLRQVNLYAANLYKAILGETKMDGANLRQTFIADMQGILRQEGMTE
jgi:uncharacterized protein YjbI with pentapeptide repeats